MMRRWVMTDKEWKERGCPRCCAYTDEGFICGKPASRIDVRRGGMVCEEHFVEGVSNRRPDDSGGR